MHLKVDEGLPGQVIAQRGLLFVANMRSHLGDTPRGKLLAEEEFTSYCVVPLVIKG